MRKIIVFPCANVQLFGSLDEGSGTTGLLIISGGNEIRIGAHRGMTQLAADVAAENASVFRFDRRGIGDSEGENGGFESSAPDISAAIKAFKAECPTLNRIIAFGNCDAATALVMHGVAGIDALILANPWVIEASEGSPPPAAIKAHYLRRLRDPNAWRSLFTGAINLRKLARGLQKIAKSQPRSTLAQSFADGLTSFSGPVTILLAERDATAIAFKAEWNSMIFEHVRAKVTLRTVQSSSHSFSSKHDYTILKSTLIESLKA